MELEWGTMQPHLMMMNLWAILQFDWPLHLKIGSDLQKLVAILLLNPLSLKKN